MTQPPPWPPRWRIPVRRPSNCAESTLPNAEATLKDLRATSRALRSITEKLESEGAGALSGRQGAAGLQAMRILAVNATATIDLAALRCGEPQRVCWPSRLPGASASAAARPKAC